MSKWEQIIKAHSAESFAMILIILALSAVMIGLLSKNRKKHRALELELQRMKGLLGSIKSQDKLENNLSVILQAISTIITAPYLAFYVLDARSGKYTLRAVSHPFDKFDQVGPSYSGLALPKREQILPPMLLNPPTVSSAVATFWEGEIRFLLLSASGERAFVRIGPVDKVAKPLRKELGMFMQTIDPVIRDLIDGEIMRMKNHVLTIGDEAIKRVARIATDTSTAVEIILESFSGIAGGIGGILIPADDSDGKQAFATGVLTDLATVIQGHSEMKSFFAGLVLDKPYTVITRTNQEFYEIPPVIMTHDVGAIAVIKIPARGTLLVLYGGQFDERKFLTDGLEQIKLLAEQLSAIAKYSSAQQRLSKTYARMLWQISDVVDNFNAYTVGYSEMMSRYSLALGREAGLSDNELRDLALASHLSNVGILGLNMDLLTKEGKYSDFEYESMKLHTQIGSSMIQISTGNERAASYVLYHHERFDGLGFPSGLSGEDIPVGSRIIHIVQVFLAKINGRAWRDPQTFEQALETLRRASGTQLDAHLVELFISWWQKKQQAPERQGKSLARCFEMCCTPRNICESCPAFESVLNCWEVGSNRCSSHGRECSSCFVRTEYLHRQQKVMI